MTGFRGRDAPGNFLRLAKGAYHKMSVAEKQAVVRGGEREPPVACPSCGTRLDAADLPNHIAHRCAGQEEPGVHWRWVNWREARRLGVSHSTLSFWARRGQVRYRGELQDRKYLLRDLALKIALRHGFRRR